jgi:hypothetical protein
MRRSLGLRSGARLAGQAAAGAILAILAVRFPDSLKVCGRRPVDLCTN